MVCICPKESILNYQIFIILDNPLRCALCFVDRFDTTPVLLRFGVIDSQRIGHFTGEVEAYLCLRDKGHTGKLIVDIIGCNGPVCNKQLFSMWRRTMRITPGWKVWEFFDRTCIFWTRGEKHHERVYGVGSAYSLLSDTKPHLRFTN